MREVTWTTSLDSMPLSWCCSEIEAKTRAALGQTDINDLYDPVEEEDATEEPAPEPEPLALGAA